MDRGIPVFNRVVISKTQRQNQISHLKRLDAIRFSQRRAQSAMKSEYNPKKELMQECSQLFNSERRTQIQKQNVLLYNKMNKILNRPKDKFDRINLSFKDTKQRFFNKIHQQNRQILKRISNQKSTICNKKLFEERQKRQKMLKYMGEYPYRQKHRNLNASISYDQRRRVQTPKNKQYILSKLQRKIMKMQNSFQQKSKRESTISYKQASQNRNQLKNQQQQQGQKQQENETVINLYRKCLQIQDEIFRIQINRYRNGYLFKLTDNLEKQYLLYLSQEEGHTLFTAYDYDFGFLASCLVLQNGQLFINIDNSKQQRQILKQHFPLSNVKQLRNDNKLRGFRLKGQIIEQDPVKRFVEYSDMTEHQIEKPEQQY